MRRGVCRRGHGCIGSESGSGVCWRRSVAQGWLRRRRRRNAASRGADRSHRLLGVDRQRGLAVAHGDAAQGRLRQRAAQRTRARKVADAWDPATDGSCQAYGAAGLMRIPTRLHITWENETTLKIETDAGQQTRRLCSTRRAGGVRRSASLQGFSLAEWERRRGGGRGAAQAPARRQSEGHDHEHERRVAAQERRAVQRERRVTEYFDRFAAPNGDEWLVVTTDRHRPEVSESGLRDQHAFQEGADGAKWAPSPCKAT